MFSRIFNPQRLSKFTTLRPFCSPTARIAEPSVIQTAIVPLVARSKLNNANGSKLMANCEKAIEKSPLKSHDTVCVGGFGLVGSPIGLLHAIAQSPSQYNHLTLVSNNPGIQDWGNGKLIHNRQVKKMILSYARNNPEFSELYFNGEIEVEWVPQGTLSEKLRAGGSGIPAFYTRTGFGSWVQHGKMPIKFGNSAFDHKVLSYSQPKPVTKFNNKEYILEESIFGNIALVKAYEADEFGNCRFHSTARNFNPDVAAAAKYTIVETEHIVPLGAMEPEDVHLPGAFVDAVVKHNAEKRVEVLKFSEFTDELSEESSTSSEDSAKYIEEENDIHTIKRTRVAKRASMELHSNMLVNLGIGIPTLIPHFLDFDKMRLWFHTENGLLGVGGYPRVGEHDPDLINAGEEVVTYVTGASMFSASESFKLVRGNHLHLSILGSMQVSQYGDIANWLNPSTKFIKGMGGAMDLVNSGMLIIGCMTHTSKKGEPKIVKECTLPLTGKSCCNRIITDLAVFDVDFEKGLTLIELLDGASLTEVKETTDCDFEVSPNLKRTAVIGW